MVNDDEWMLKEICLLSDLGKIKLFLKIFK